MKDLILEIGTNTSGIDEGEIDYSFRPQNLEKLSTEEKIRVRRMLFEHIIRCDKEIIKESKPSLIFKIWRIVDLNYFPIFKKNYSMWPIKVKRKTQMKNLMWKWNDQPFITAHGWQNGWKDSKRHYGWTLHLGNTMLVFGKKRLP